MKKQNTENLNIHVGRNPSVLVVVDVPARDVFDADLCMTVPEMKVFMREATACGFDKEDFVFICPCPPIDAEGEVTDSQAGKHVDAYHDEFMDAYWKVVLDHDISMAVTLGRWAARQAHGSSVQITRLRGTVQAWPSDPGCTYLPLFSPREVLRFPDRRDIYNTDFHQLAALREVGWSRSKFREAASGSGYKWCLDLSELLDNPPEAIALDTETVGMEFRKPGFRVLTVQITRRKGESLVVPLDLKWWNNDYLMSGSSKKAPRLNTALRRKLIRQLKTLLSNPEVHVVGHNLKYDIHVLHTLGIDVANWHADTIQLAFAVDENMQSKSLNDCTRRWLPQFAGYVDQFDSETDKSRMDLVNHVDFLAYAGGDTEVTYRLASILIKEAKKDARNWNTFVKVQMPALRMFVKMERRGIRIDTSALRNFGAELAVMERNLFHKLIEKCPPALLRQRVEQKKAVSFDSSDFLIDLLFGPLGIRVDGEEVVERGGKPLKPIVFTKGKKPSTSGKNHLPYFEHIGFIRDLIEYKAVSKMRSTYVGEEARVQTESVKRLKNGDLPKPVKVALLEEGITLPKAKTRRRSEVPGLAEKFAELGATDTHTVRLPGKKGSVEIDLKGNAKYVKNIEASGFWQYIKNPVDPYIYPSLWAHRTVTGRMASSDPNSQNYPKRGELAEIYRRIFVAAVGWLFGEVDLSQAEIRVAACMAGEREMLRIYNNDGDIHVATAAAVMGVTEEAFVLGSNDNTPLIDVANVWPGAGEYLQKLSPGKRRTVTVAKYLDFKRFCAKAVNFGFLYGMGWRKFKSYTRTDYKIVYSDKEAEETREMFFHKYPRLQGWHEAMREFLRKHGYVRALHGSLRRLPNIGSDDDMIVGMSSRQGINAPVQRFASDLALMGAIRFDRDADEADMRIAMFIHDANIAEAKEECIEEAVSALKYYMESTPLEEWFGITLPCKIVADGCIGPNLGSMAKRPDLEAVQPSWFRSGEHPPLVGEISESMQDRWQALTDFGVIIPG